MHNKCQTLGTIHMCRASGTGLELLWAIFLSAGDADGVSKGTCMRARDPFGTLPAQVLQEKARNYHVFLTQAGGSQSIGNIFHIPPSFNRTYKCMLTRRAHTYINIDNTPMIKILPHMPSDVAARTWQPQHGKMSHLPESHLTAHVVPFS